MHCNVHILKPTNLWRLLALALEWERSLSLGTDTTFQAFPLSSLAVTPWRKYTARSSKPIAHTWAQRHHMTFTDLSVTTAEMISELFSFKTYTQMNTFIWHNISYFNTPIFEHLSFFSQKKNVYATFSFLLFLLKYVPRVQLYNVKSTQETELRSTKEETLLISDLIIETHVDHDHLSNHTYPTWATRIMRVHTPSKPDLIKIRRRGKQPK